MLFRFHIKARPAANMSVVSFKVANRFAQTGTDADQKSPREDPALALRPGGGIDNLSGWGGPPNTPPQVPPASPPCGFAAPFPRAGADRDSTANLTGWAATAMDGGPRGMASGHVGNEVGFTGGAGVHAPWHARAEAA
jgi:hypothetical protein